MTRHTTPILGVVHFFIWTCVILVSAGWLLGTLGLISRWTSGTVLLSALAVCTTHFLPTRCNFLRHLSAGNGWHRLFPAVFVTCALLVGLGGALHAPNNYDHLTYRFPRMMHWFAEGRWFWIDTPDARMNFSATGFEFILMPIYAISGNDRFFFLINWTAFLLMPGVLFGLMRQVHVPRQTAWTWMWVIPCSYGYTMQAGSVGNDFIGAFLIMVALFLVLRARQSRDVRDWGTGLLAAALATSVKLSSVFLLLPVLVALIAIRPLLISHRLFWPLTVMSVFVSALPISLLNWVHTGSITGDPRNLFHLQSDAPVAACVANLLQTLTDNLSMPIMPWANIWNCSYENIIPANIVSWLRMGHARFSLSLNELPNEEWVGLGAPIWAGLLLFRWVAHRQHPRKTIWPVTWSMTESWILWAGVASMFGLMSFLGSEAIARIALPYYIFAMLLLLRSTVAVGRCLHAMLLLASASTFIPLVLTPSRPLWPAASVTARLQQKYPTSTSIARAYNVYATYQQRADLFQTVRKHLPPSARRVGFAGAGDDPSSSLWRPYGQRVVIPIPPSHLPNSSWLDRRDLHWVVVRQSVLRSNHLSLDDWLRLVDARVIFEATFTTKVQEGPDTWYLVKREPQIPNPQNKT